MNRIQYYIDPIALTAGLHTSYNPPCNICHIHSLKLGQTVLTVAAVVGTIFSKIPQNIIPQTFIGKTVKGHLSQPFPVPLLYQSAGYFI